MAVVVVLLLLLLAAMLAPMEFLQRRRRHFNLGATFFCCCSVENAEGPLTTADGLPAAAAANVSARVLAWIFSAIFFRAFQR